MAPNIIKATNNAKTLKVKNVGGGKIKLIAVFSKKGAESERTLSWWKVWKRFYFLRPGKYGCHVDFGTELRLARFAKTDVHLYFEPPTNGCAPQSLVAAILGKSSAARHLFGFVR